MYSMSQGRNTLGRHGSTKTNSLETKVHANDHREHTTAAHEATAMYGGGEVALGPQQVVEVVDRGERVRIPIAEGLALHLQRLAQQRLSGGEVEASVSGCPRVSLSRNTSSAPHSAATQRRRARLGVQDQRVVFAPSCRPFRKQSIALQQPSNSCFGVIKP